MLFQVGFLNQQAPVVLLIHYFTFISCNGFFPIIQIRLGFNDLKQHVSSFLYFKLAYLLGLAREMKLEYIISLEDNSCQNIAI